MDTLRKQFFHLTGITIPHGGKTIGTAEERYIKLAMMNDLGFDRQMKCVDYGWIVRYVKGEANQEWQPIRWEDNAVESEYRIAIEALRLYRRVGRVTGEVTCHDCGLDYGSPGWMDAIVADEVWLRISPTGDEGGILCINCIAKRCAELDLHDVPVAIQSGPLVCGTVIGVRPLRLQAHDEPGLRNRDTTATGTAKE